MLRTYWRWLYAAAQRVAPEGTLRWHVATWIGHSALAAILVGLFALPLLIGVDVRWIGAGAGGGFYTVEEFRQRFIYQPPTTAPWWDSALDVLCPWAVGIGLTLV